MVLIHSVICSHQGFSVRDIGSVWCCIMHVVNRVIGYCDGISLFVGLDARGRITLLLSHLSRQLSSPMSFGTSLCHGSVQCLLFPFVWFPFGCVMSHSFMGTKISGLQGLHIGRAAVMNFFSRRQHLGFTKGRVHETSGCSGTSLIPIDTFPTFRLPLCVSVCVL